MSAFHFPVLGMVGLRVGAESTAGPTGSIWPAAFRILYVPFQLADSLAVQRVFVPNNFAPAGSLNIGVYTVAGALLTSTGIQPRVGAVVNQHYTMPITLAKGWYYFACVADSAVGSTWQGLQGPPANGLLWASYGCKQEDNGSLLLPANMTAVAQTTDRQMYYGLCTSATL